MRQFNLAFLFESDKVCSTLRHSETTLGKAMSGPLIYVIEAPHTAEYFRDLLVSHFGGKVEVVLGYTASDLWHLMQTRGRPDAIIIQRKIDYGPEILEVNPDIHFDDERTEHAGSRILRFVHECSVVLSAMFVVLLDGFDPVDFAGPIDRATRFLREHGLLSVEYQKPFDSSDLIGRLCERFGLENPFPPLSEWAPEHSVSVGDDPEDESEG